MELVKNLQKKIDDILAQYPLVQKIVKDIHHEGGISYLVGGGVRDIVLNLPFKDLDIEIHKLSLQTLEQILNRYGHVNNVGKIFGVLRLESLDIDWSIPRTDESGRKPHVKIDPWMELEKAFERRDLTMNAMGINLITYELIDPFNGLRDIKQKILRTPNPAFFIEDPLRFYRVMQFISRFDMQPDRILNFICSTMDISHVSHERIEMEFKKWLLQSKEPSKSIVWLDSLQRLQEVMPEIAQTKGLLQEPDWHPEGDVFEHTKQIIDAAAALNYSSLDEKLIIMYAVLCHDLGKITTTRMVNGRLRSHNHAQQGVPLTRRFLKRITRNTELIDKVVKLVETHMAPAEFIEGNAGSGAYKRLAYKLAPNLNLAMLAQVSLADQRGRNGKRGKPLTSEEPLVEKFLLHAQKAGVLTTNEKPLLQGKDLMPEVEPGPQMGFLVKEAYALQLCEDINDKEILKELLFKRHNIVSSKKT